MASLLIVDDDHDGRAALCAFLSRKGHQVAGVASGQAALASFLSLVPDVVILDLLMPGMDGGSLLSVIRSDLRLRSLPVIILTGYPDCAVVERARELKVDVVLTKGGATFEDVARTIDEQLRSTSD